MKSSSAVEEKIVNKVLIIFRQTGIITVTEDKEDCTMPDVRNDRRVVKTKQQIREALRRQSTL